MSLSDYQLDVTALLHDFNYQFNSQAMITRWINQARREAAERSGCIRRLLSGQSAFGASAQPGQAIPGALQPGAMPGAFPGSQVTVQGTSQNAMQTIVNVERYPFQGFFNPFLQRQHAGCKGVMDVIDCAVSWAGVSRPSLAWMPWDDLQAYARAYNVLTSSYPFYWSVISDGEYGEVWLFPVPCLAGDIELDCFCYPTDLNSNDDFDAIPAGFRDAVKYGACKRAYLGSQRWMQAQLMENEFASRIGVAAVAVDRGKVPNYYYQRF